MNSRAAGGPEAFPAPSPAIARVQSETLEPAGSEAGTQQKKAVKRRASQACQSCRARKVRCNVAKYGAPCVHCRLDEIECVVGESKRKKKKTADEAPSSSRNGSNAVLLPSHPGQMMSPDFFQNLERPRLQSSISASTMAFPRAPTSPLAVPAPILPAYIKPLPARFGSDDVTYLHNKGALTIPSRELRDELLRCYTEFMHPLMPLLDVQKFVQTIDRNDGTQPVSLLLFQAVMFTGVAFVEIDLLKAAGYDNRREARRIFFNRTRLLYDLDYEDDSIALIQALLLMTYWRENPASRKETVHWIEIAISLSLKVGLHRNVDDSNASDSDSSKLRRRIWWSAYMRDCQIALGTKTSTRIKDVNFDVQMLQLSDFELETSSDGSMLVDCRPFRDKDEQRQLAIICIEMAKLCLCVSHILSVQYGATSSKGSTRTATMLFAKPPESGREQMGASAKALQQWKEALPTPARYVAPTANDLPVSDPSVTVSRAFLHMFFYATVARLHRPLLRPSTNSSLQGVPVLTSTTAYRMTSFAATGITSIAGSLYSRGLVRYLPSATITVLLAAIEVHLQETLAPSQTLRLKSLQDFCKCMQIMGALRDMYAAADYSTAFLQSAIQRTELGVLPQENEARADGVASPTSQEPTGTEVQLRPSGSGQRSTAPSTSPAEHSVDFTALHTNGPPSVSDAMENDDNIDRRTASSLISTDSPSNLGPGYRHQNRMSTYSQTSMLDAMYTAADPLPMNPAIPLGQTTINHGSHALDFGTMGNVKPAQKPFDPMDDESTVVPGDGHDFSLNADWLASLGAEELMLPGDDGSSIIF